MRYSWQILPRRAEFVVVLQDVLVDAIERHRRRHARSADGGLEAIGAGDGVVGEDAAVAPAGDASRLGSATPIATALSTPASRSIDFVVAPVGRDRLGVILPAPRTAAIVDVQLGIALGRQPLAQKVEAVLVLPVGTAVDEQNHRHRRSRLEVRRLGQQAVHFGAVLALELDVFGRHQVQLGHQRIVVRGQLAQRAVLKRIDLARVACRWCRARPCARRPHPTSSPLPAASKAASIAVAG